MKSLLLILFCLLAAVSFSQEIPATTEQQLENLGDENLEDDAFLQQLAYYQKHPLNLNTATAEEFYPLRFLTALQIQNLIRYRASFGKLVSVYELQAVPGFDLVTIQRLMPFVYAGETKTLKETFAARLRGGSQSVLFRISRVLEKARGYDTTLKTHYLGDPNRLLFRYTYQYQNLLYFGVTADKDAGEQFFKGKEKQGFDFYSAHFFARNLGHVKALALGDYVVNLGQGLTQWQSLAFGKSADVINIKRQSQVLLPYRSAGEFYFNRGAALTLQFGRWQLTPFVSYKRFSGNLVSDSVDRFTSFGTSGYYRTQAELADRYRLTDFSTGGNLTYSSNALAIGLNAVSHQFSLPLQKTAEPYNRFAPVGKNFLLTSVNYSYTYKNAHFFGEAATDRQWHHAFVQGALVTVDPKVDLSLLYRNIHKAYQAPFGNAFTESTLPSNEEGFYTGLLLRPATGWQVSAYADFYRFPFLKYRLSAPARGVDYLLQVYYAPDKQTDLYVRYRNETKPLNDAGLGSVIQFPFDQQRQSLRFNFSTQLSRSFALKGRTELTWFAKNKNSSNTEDGFLTYVEGRYEPSGKWRGNLRLQYFETGGYDSRIYAYESDVLYSFSIPAFFDKGFRYYLVLSHDFGKHLTFWIRAAQTLYANKQTIGSGLDEITGSRRTEVKLQFLYRF